MRFKIIGELAALKMGLPSARLMPILTALWVVVKDCLEFMVEKTMTIVLAPVLGFL